MPRPKPKRYAAVVPDTPRQRAANALFAAECFVPHSPVSPVCWITARKALLDAKRLIADMSPPLTMAALRKCHRMIVRSKRAK